jgi:hypothetical protein
MILCVPRPQQVNNLYGRLRSRALLVTPEEERAVHQRAQTSQVQFGQRLAGAASRIPAPRARVRARDPAFGADR